MKRVIKVVVVAFISYLLVSAAACTPEDWEALEGQPSPVTTAPAQGEQYEKDLKAVHEKLDKINELLDKAITSLKEDDFSNARKYGDLAEAAKHELLLLPAFSDARVFGVSVYDWVLFAEFEDLQINYAAQAGIFKHKEEAIDHLENAKRTKEGLESKLPPKGGK